MSQFLIARSFNLQVFKTEAVDELTVEQYNALSELYIYEHEKELEELNRLNSDRAGKGTSTVRISNSDR